MSTGNLGNAPAVGGYLGAKMAVIGQELGVNERWFLTADTLNVKLPKTAGLTAGNYVSIIRALDGNFTPQIQSQDAAFVYTDGGVYGGANNVTFELTAPAIVLYWNGEAWQDEEYTSADSANAIRQGEKIFTKSGHLDIPAVNSVTVTVVGGGGGGGCGANHYASERVAAGGGGGGGGGGAVVDAVIDVTPGKRVTVLVGGGGRHGLGSYSGSSDGGDGGDGGNSSFGDYVTANGGKGGLGGHYGSVSAVGGTGGTGGTVNAPDGVTATNGGNGGRGGNGNPDGVAPTGESGGNVGDFQGGKSVKTHPSDGYHYRGGGGGGGASAKGAGASCRYQFTGSLIFGGEDGSLYGGGGSGRSGWVASPGWPGGAQHAGNGASGIVIVKWGDS